MSKQSQSVIQPFPPDDGRDWECQCARCGSSVDFRECEQCRGEGVDGHDCGEDCCMCLYPEDNQICHICFGHGGDYWCMSSPEFCNANPLDDRENIKRGQIEWHMFEDFGEGVFDE